MLQGLYAAASGMEAMQNQFNSVANDMANLDTPGYQGTETGFESLLYSKGGVSTGSQLATGTGAASQIIGRDQTEGALQQTGRSLDVALEGPGYLQVKRSDGETGLTRNGTLETNADGQLTDENGNRLQPPITVPKGVDASQVKIDSQGQVTANGRTLGKLSIVNVPAPTQLQPIGNSMFAVTAGSGGTRAATGTTVQQGALEGSNVDIAQTMANMVNTQRTYQMSEQAIQYQDQMLQIANEIKKS